MTENKMLTEEALLHDGTQMLTAGEVLVQDAVVEAVPITPKRKRRFWPWLCAYTVLLVAVAAFGLVQWYTHLQAYEEAIPNNMLSRFLEWIETDDYEALYACADYEETVLNTKAEYLRYLERVYGNAQGTLSMRKLRDVSAYEQEYAVYAGEKELTKAMLIKNPAWGEAPWTIYTVCQPIEAVAVIAEEDTRISINGVELALLNLPPQAVQEIEFAGSSKTDVLPVVHRYTIEGLLNLPEITGLTLGGESCTVQAEGETVYRVLHPTTAETKAMHEALAQETAADYAAFTAKRLKIKVLKQRLHEFGDLYNAADTFTGFIQPTPSSYECGEMTVSEYRALTARDFSCTVRFQPTMVQKGQKVTGNEVAYRLTFLSVEGNWKLLSLTDVK